MSADPADVDPVDPGAVDVVLFDLDDTLCEYRRTGAELLSLAFEEVGVEPFFDVTDYHARYSEFVAESRDMRDLRERCFGALARERDRDPSVGRAVARAYAAERDHRNVRALPGAVEAVERLSAHHRVGLVTNGSPGMQRQKLDAVGLADAFETVVFAGYDAPAKPAPDPFHRALEALDADADADGDRAVHVGNSLASDVPGALSAGVRAAWLAGESPTDPDPDPRPHYTLRSMHDLHEPPWWRE